MTGVLNAVIGTPSRERIVVTLLDNGGGSIGIASTSIPMRTTNFLYVDCVSGSTLRVQLDTVLSQSYFNSLRVQDGSGAIQAFDPAAASFFSTAGNQSQWHWTVTSFWTAGDVGESKLLEFVF